MKADITRNTFKTEKHYRRVDMQQGRVQLDADWNEQNKITEHRIETETVDVAGACAVPMHDAGFHIVATAADLTVEEKTLAENQNPPAPAAGDLLISGGRAYVSGALCENDSIVTYTKQPDLPKAAVVAQQGTYLAYLDVWDRSITALEDPQIREVALGGPDTATRAKVVWQVKLFRVGDSNLAANCSTDFSSWNNETAAGTGKLAAQAAPGAVSDKPCIVAPGAGFRRLENQLYRVEVHDKGALGTATFKWSRDNGSIVSKWESEDKILNKITVSSPGRDKVLSFASGQWVELSDDTTELLGLPGTLVQLVKAEGNVLMINPATKTGPVDLASFPSNPKVRRWDHAALLKPINNNWAELEDGVQVRFDAGTFKSGDYWTIPARTATADVEWPKDPGTKQPVTQLPFGIRHSYCRLSVLKFDGAKWTSATDCRNIFPPLAEITSFFMLGGDGQEAHPNGTLDYALEVGVANGEYPVAGARVRFSLLSGGGILNGAAAPVEVLTGADGVAKCDFWVLGNQAQKQQVRAELLRPDNSRRHLPIDFSADYMQAVDVIYQPGKCGKTKNAKNVQDAIDQLCQPDPRVRITGVSVPNDTQIPAQKFLQEGILVDLDQEIDGIGVKPSTCFVTMEVPGLLPTVEAPGPVPIIRLAGELKVTAGKQIVWAPTKASQTWVSVNLPSLQASVGNPPILIRFTIMGNYIWAKGDESVYLDGEVFGKPRGDGTIGLVLPSGDGKQGGNFEMWFFLLLELSLKVTGVRVSSTAVPTAVVTMTTPATPLQVPASSQSNFIEVDFSTPVDNVSAQNFFVERSLGPMAVGFVPVPGTVTMQSATRARFSPTQGAFGMGTFRVLLSGEGATAIRSRTGRLLDGEPKQLPSGDGTDGGSFAFTMVIA